MTYEIRESGYIMTYEIKGGNQPLTVENRLQFANTGNRQPNKHSNSKEKQENRSYLQKKNCLPLPRKQGQNRTYFSSISPHKYSPKILFYSTTLNGRPNCFSMQKRQ